MPIELREPSLADLTDVTEALRSWQQDGEPHQLHPGDIGWFWRFGADATAAALRVWSDGDRILAAGFLDGPGLLRMTTAPDVRADGALAARIAADLDEPRRGVLPAGEADVELPADAAARDVLAANGWGTGESWTALRRDVSEPVEPCGIRVEIVDGDLVSARTAVQRSAFERSTFTEQRWHIMAEGPLYADARCLVGFDDRGEAVAVATVWSAGAGRPGLLEPVGVHNEHRGRGYGRAISVAAAAALRQLGASSAVVNTESSNVGAVATYRSAGFTAQPEVLDLRRG